MFCTNLSLFELICSAQGPSLGWITLDATQQSLFLTGTPHNCRASISDNRSLYFPHCYWEGCVLSAGMWYHSWEEAREGDKEQLQALRHLRHYFPCRRTAIYSATSDYLTANSLSRRKAAALIINQSNLLWITSLSQIL